MPSGRNPINIDKDDKILTKIRILVPLLYSEKMVHTYCAAIMHLLYGVFLALD
jgi:hypothetical protein